MPFVPIASTFYCTARLAACLADRFKDGDRFQRDHPSPLPKPLRVLGKENHHGVVKKQGGDVNYSSLVPEENKILRFEGENKWQGEVMSVVLTKWYALISLRFFRKILLSFGVASFDGEGVGGKSGMASRSTKRCSFH